MVSKLIQLKYRLESKGAHRCKLQGINLKINHDLNFKVLTILVVFS
ncbi:MAG: hypothetical protein A4E48_01015 [Methanosaeta sp. PtaU1.Bin060]|nr:MAG: hypothetical protein A4E48_01015 [Methanosaeta sp. PtaU1.Bin060]